jgi:predicted transposase/invertase (TIGR01784 family)
MNFTPEEREAYEDRLKWLRIEANTLKKYQQQGIEIGRAEGMAERNIEIAKNLLSQNIDIKTIAVATGLSPDDIIKLKS